MIVIEIAIDLFLYVFSFLAIWFGAGLIVESVENLSHKLNISSFAASFFVLGFLTSLPEALVGINAIIDQDPEIFVGNLIGGSLVLFIFVIPILAIFGNGIKLTHQLDGKRLLLSLFVVCVPAFLVVDRQITVVEGLLLILLYFALFYSIEKRKGLFEAIKDRLIDGKRTHAMKDVSSIVFGAIILFFSSKIVVDKTILFSDIFNISPFLIGLLVLSLGTNLPELSLAVRSVALGKKEVAFGDYIGSAAANTFIFGFLTILNQGVNIATNNFLKTLIFMLLGLGLFLYFSRSKNDISRNEGLLLLFVYFAFVLFEVLV